MINIKLLLNGKSIGSITINQNKIIQDVTLHENSEEISNILNEYELLGKKVTSEDYYEIFY